MKKKSLQVSLSSCSKRCTLQFAFHLRVPNVLLHWWKWQNLVLTPRIFATMRNCGLFSGLKEGIAQRIPKARETYKQTNYFIWSDWAFETICLGSDNDKAGGKHRTIWAVTACDFTSERERERELCYSPVEWCLLKSSYRSAWLCLAHTLWWVQNILLWSWYKE